MTHPEVFEGTWEELAAHAEAFKGRKLRLIVLPVAIETTAASNTDELRLRAAAARLFAGGGQYRAYARHTQQRSV